MIKAPACNKKVNVQTIHQRAAEVCICASAYKKKKVDPLTRHQSAAEIVAAHKYK